MVIGCDENKVDDNNDDTDTKKGNKKETNQDSGYAGKAERTLEQQKTGAELKACKMCKKHTTVSKASPSSTEAMSRPHTPLSTGYLYNHGAVSCLM